MFWHKILTTARYTPSPHNVQPWKVQIIDASHAELFIDQSRTLPAEDTTGSFILSAMGMFLEAMRIISINEGAEFRYELTNELDPVAGVPFARLFLKPNPSLTPVYSNETFLKRRTARFSSKPQPIPPEAIQKLSLLAKNWGHNFNTISDPENIHKFIEKNITAVFYDLNDPPYHDEITSWFRYSNRQGQARKDGLEARCMKVPGFEFYLFAKFPFVLKIPGISWMARNHYRKRLGKTYTLGIISGPFWEKKDAIKAGKFLINIWLEMTQYDLFIHPFGNLVTNHEANRWVHAKTKLKDIWLVFRVGFSEPVPQSHRLNLEDIIVDRIH